MLSFAYGYGWFDSNIMAKTKVFIYSWGRNENLTWLLAWPEASAQVQRPKIDHDHWIVMIMRRKRKPMLTMIVQYSSSGSPEIEERPQLGIRFDWHASAVETTITSLIIGINVGMFDTDDQALRGLRSARDITVQSIREQIIEEDKKQW